MSRQIIRHPASCPKCGARTCIEWDWKEPTTSTLHCRAQHANAQMCDFREPLGIEPAEGGWTLIAVSRNGEEDAAQTFRNQRGATP